MAFFFQWVLCVAIWHVGLTVNLIRSQPEFQPVAMCGGLIWATGNLLTVPVITRIGLALGLLIWGATGMITGWLSGVIGFMGINKETDEITSWGLNISGMLVALGAMSLSVLVRPDITVIDEERLILKDGTDHIPDSDQEADYDSLNGGVNGQPLALKNVTPVDEASEMRNRIVGCGLAVIAGCFFGINFDPPQYVMDRVDGSSQNSLDYVFSHFCGILLASTVWFACYCGYKTRYGQRIEIYPNVILPAMVSGIMWGIAQTAFFIANEKLAFVVSFPMVNLGPGFIGFLWGVFLFKEIYGTRNYLIVFGVFVGAAACCICVVFSRA